MKKTLQQKANALARSKGYGIATEIVLIDETEPKIIRHIKYGYRKNTTDEYVPNAYRQNFGWKNTYYQPAVTVV